jgi:hypothetical protein
MSNSRRNFLQHLGLGALGTGLLLPGAAQARRCKRGGGASYSSTVLSQHGYGGNLSSGYPVQTSTSNLLIMPGGDFFIWGTKDQLVTNLTFTITDGTWQQIAGTTVQPALPDTENNKTTWSYLCRGVSKDQMFYLTANYLYNTQAATPEHWGPYTAKNP